MKMYILQQRDGVYFKNYNSCINALEWTGVIKRAAYWLDYEVASDQAFDLSLSKQGDWLVKEIEL